MSFGNITHARSRWQTEVGSLTLSHREQSDKLYKACLPRKHQPSSLWSRKIEFECKSHHHVKSVAICVVKQRSPDTVERDRNFYTVQKRKPKLQIYTDQVLPPSHCLLQLNKYNPHIWFVSSKILLSRCQNETHYRVPDVLLQGVHPSVIIRVWRW